MRKGNLLAEAKRLSGKNQAVRFTSQETGLVLGYLKGEVGLSAVKHVVKFPSTSQTYVFVARALKQAYTDGRIKVR